MFSQRIPKAIDALSTAGIAAVMQVLVIGPWLTARIQATRDPEALGYHFIGLGMVMFFFFCLSLTFFIMALVKYRAAIKEGALPQYPIDSLINVTEEGRDKSSCGQSEH